MAELATIARPYAEALFKACAASSGADLAATASWLDELALIADNSQVRQLADNPKVTADQVFDLFVGVARSALPDMARNFLRTVIDNDRLAVLPEVARQFRALANGVGGTTDAVVYTPFPLSAAELANLLQSLERRFGRKLQLTQQADPSLIGGVRVVVGDEVLDTSVKARLERMKVALSA